MFNKKKFVSKKRTLVPNFLQILKKKQANPLISTLLFTYLRSTIPINPSLNLKLHWKITEDTIEMKFSLKR